jgi:glycyl-tRNA synthetase alpha chain
MYIQKKNNVYDLQWSDNITYGEIYFEREKQWSIYNFDAVNVDLLKRHFEDWEIEAKRLVEIGLVFPAYDAVMKCSHIFNLLDSGGSIGVSERTCYISRVRIVSKLVARKYLMLSRAEV